MAELDTIEIVNPTKEDFTVNFNGEPYFIEAGKKKSFPEFLANHIAKHLSDKMLGKEVLKLKAKRTENPYNPAVGQLMVYDNPKRRMALYDILKTKERVEKCLNAYPFKGFIGEMSEYDEYVEKQNIPVKKETEELTANKKK